MTNYNTFMFNEIQVWAKCGVGRTVRLAKVLGTTHNSISVMLGDKWMLSDAKIKQVKAAIEIVEAEEVNNKKHVENIVLRSTALTFHPERWIANQAKKSLKKFSLIYLTF